MRFNDLFNRWTDLGELSFGQVHPNTIIRAADLARHCPYSPDSALLAGGIERRVSYETAAGVRYILGLAPYVHPTGAGSLTIATVAYDSAGLATVTPVTEGLMIGEDGALVPIAGAPQESGDIAGALFGDYYTHFDGNYDRRETYHALTIEEGDFLWVVRNGLFQMKYDGAAPTVGKHVVSSATTAGRVQAALLVNTAGTNAQLYATMLQNQYGEKQYLGLGRAAVLGAAGEVWVELELPPRRVR